jgi:hypothetical protein
MNLLASIAVLTFALLQAPKPVPATFTGVFRGIESGHLVIEVQDGQDLRMFVIGSTKFIRDGKPSKASQFHDGDRISVDAERDARMNLVALRVEAVPPPQSPGPPTETGKPN